MKIDETQAHRIRAELIAHIGYNDSESIACFNRFTAMPVELKTNAEVFNAMLEAGDAHLTSIVLGMIERDLQK